MSEPTAQALSHQLASQLAAFVPAHFSSQLHHACTRFSETADGVPEDQHPAKILIETITAEKVTAAQLAKLWLCSEFALDHCCANSAVLLELIASGDLNRSYHHDITSACDHSAVYSAVLEAQLNPTKADEEPLAGKDELS